MRSESPLLFRQLVGLSWFVSTLGLIVGIAIWLGFVLPPILDLFRGTDDWKWDKRTTTRPPEVTSSPLCPGLVGNETTCFRFASSVTARHCSELGGVFVNVSSYNSSSSSSSSSSSLVAASVSSTLCYHNVCTDYVVNNTCFQHRSDSSAVVFHDSELFP